jgi:hypothetical protein
MDYEFYMRAAKAGRRIDHVHACWGEYRLHEMSKSVRSSDLQRSDAEAIAARYQRASAGPLEKIFLKLLWSFYRICRKALGGSYFMSTRDPRGTNEN